jgi:hypothetical protein
MVGLDFLLKSFTVVCVLAGTVLNSYFNEVFRFNVNGCGFVHGGKNAREIPEHQQPDSGEVIGMFQQCGPWLAVGTRCDLSREMHAHVG